LTDNIHNLGTKKAMAYAFAFFCLFCAIQLALLSKQYQYKTEEWVMVGENISGYMSYEKKSVVRNISGEIIVLTKHTYSFEAHNVMAAVLPNIARFLYVLMLDKIDCGEQAYISLRMVYKTVDGKTLYDTIEGKGKYKRIGYRPIPPNSLIGQVANAICAGFSI